MSYSVLIQHGRAFLAGLDQVRPWFLLLVIPLFLVVVGAVVVAAIVLLVAAFLVANCAGVVLLARRAIHAAATYRPTAKEVPA